MKDVIKVIIPIILVMIITLLFCKIFIKPKVFNFKETDNFKYIEKNKDNVEQFVVRTITLLGEYCYEINIDKGYNALNNISIKKETNMHTFDSDMYLEIYFKDETLKSFYFEGDNLVYNNKKYELDNKVILVNKDEYMPDKITKGMIIVSDKDRVECN